MSYVQVYRTYIWEELDNQLIRLKFNPKSCKLIQMSEIFIRKFKRGIYGLYMNVHTHKLYLLEQHSESFGIWSAITKINTEGKSLIMKSSSNIQVMRFNTTSLIA